MEAQLLAAGGGAGRHGRMRLSRLRDEGLARLAGTGSEWAFAALYERYHQPLYRYCRSILRHHPDAEDALQATFASAYAALRESRRNAPLRPWLFRIAHNEAITVLRQRRAREEVPESLPARDADVEARAEMRERLEQLVADLQALPDRQRSALVMRELGGLSHEDIALALDASPAAAKQAIFEARRTLASFDEGRSMSCDHVCRTISDRDRRALRSHSIRAHLRNCAECAAFAEAIPARSADLRALAPALPPGAATGILWRAIGSGGSGGGSGSGATATGFAGKTAVTVGSAKVAAGVAVVSAMLGATVVLKSGRPARHPSPAVSRSASVGTSAAVAPNRAAAPRGARPGRRASRNPWQ
jgi:RNA polymerase sigma factor (sigma-70 family)